MNAREELGGSEGRLGTKASFRKRQVASAFFEQEGAQELLSLLCFGPESGCCHRGRTPGLSACPCEDRLPCRQYRRGGQDVATGRALQAFCTDRDVARALRISRS
jgi:hypothetical protein